MLIRDPQKRKTAHELLFP
ncbi:hypothetical protein QN277_013212 [Acacia crassicarpa]|uniref:Uncharacterized protein n=1 Tax=Acacia crassicarpa TaxID=499986 RepID=A0AAE1N2Q1_9FABA|nr:hypothetical protein QN277_013212 [Acacia crassicarpa]